MTMHPSLVLPKWRFDSSVTAINASAVPDWATHLFYSPGFAHDGPNISLVWASGDTGVVRAVDAADDSVHVHNKRQNSFLGTLKSINLGKGSLWRCLGSRVPALANGTRKAVVPPLVRIPTDFKANEDFINEMRRVDGMQPAFAAPYGVDFEILEKRVLASYQQIAKDPYKELAAKLFEVPVADVTKEQRQIAKRFHFYCAAERAATNRMHLEAVKHMRVRQRELACAIRHNLNAGKDCPLDLLIGRNMLRERIIELEKQP